MAASLAVHVVLLAIVAVHAPRLRVPEGESGPPQAIIPILIMPRAPPPAASPGAKPAPIRLHRRPQRFALEPVPVAPLVAPEAPAAPRPAQASGPRVLTLPSSQDAVAVRARKALRARLNCDSPQLTDAERRACEDRFAARARDAPFLGLGVEREKARELDAAAARRQADYNYKRGIRPPAPASKGLPWDVDRGPGGQAEAMGRAMGNDRPTATRPF